MASWRAGWFLGWPEKVHDESGASCYARKEGNAQRMIRRVTRTQNNINDGVGENRKMTRKENNGRQESSRSRMLGANCEQWGCCWHWKIIIVLQPPRSNLVQAIITKRCYSERRRFDQRQDAHMPPTVSPRTVHQEQLRKSDNTLTRRTGSFQVIKQQRENLLACSQSLHVRPSMYKPMQKG